MTNVLVVGSGAREVAISRKISQSNLEKSLFCVSPDINPQILNLCKDYMTSSLDRVDEIVGYALLKKISFVFVGPENPLAFGLVNKLAEVGIPSVGPKKEVAMIESSKAFARTIIDGCDKDKNPKRKEFTSTDSLVDFIEELGGNYVIKNDGLMGGKGVKISGEHLMSIDEGLRYATEIVENGGSFLIEEKLVGEEFSLMSFCDGLTCKHMPIVQDHKRAFEGDVGPNTGGMGTYSFSDHSLPFLEKNDVLEAQKTNELVAKELFRKTGTPFVGILYGGFMLTKNGVKVIEYNARFGDPEAMNVLSVLKTDFLSLCLAIVGGSLSGIDVKFENLSTVCKYAVPSGYPDSPKKGFLVGCDITDENLYLASVKLDGGALLAGGSRTAAYIGKEKNIVEAERACEAGVEKISGDLFHRKDIGTNALINSRVKRMKGILG